MADIELPTRLATVKEACVYAKIGMTKLYAHLNRGTFVAYKRENQTLIDLDTVDNWTKASLRPWLPASQRTSGRD
ncbi:helix-turn-helix domain-containing protein [Bradyrhizobium sp. INPA03-11B]|uniref:helix-turn-helix domain-containing protein n=1 Tax=Bradyrhizobium sp. INPA03-11B TaxID=418598 RepID=UPI00338F6897